ALERVGRGRRSSASKAGPTPRVADDPEAALGAAVAEIGEADDRLFFRAQACVRRALLALGRRLGLAADDVFFLSLEALVALERDAAPADGQALGRAADEARARRDAQRKLAMPLAVRNGQAISPRARHGQEVWRGRGFGPPVRGHVVRADDLGE